MSKEYFIERIEDLEDNQSFREREFEDKIMVPKKGDSVATRHTPQSYFEFVDFMTTTEGYFPLETYSYVTHIHTNEIIIWNRYTKRINLRQLFNIIKN